MKDACFQDHGSSASVESVGRQTTPRWSTTMSSVDPGAHERPRRGGKGPTKGARADSFLDRILFWRSVRNDIASMRANIEKLSVELPNLITHLDTSLHSRLNTLENDYFVVLRNALVQISELCADA